MSKENVGHIQNKVLFSHKINVSFIEHCMELEILIGNQSSDLGGQAIEGYWWEEGRASIVGNAEGWISSNYMIFFQEKVTVELNLHSKYILILTFKMWLE